MLGSIVDGALFLLAMALPFSIAISSLLFFPLLALWVLGAKWTFRRWPPRIGPTEKAFILFAAVSLVSALAGINRAHSLHEIYKKDFYFLIVVVVLALTRTQAKAEKLIRAFVGAGVASALLGLAQKALGINQSDRAGGIFFHLPPAVARWPRPLLDHLSIINGRAAGTLSHPLTYAESLLFVLSFCATFAMFARARDGWKWLVPTWLVCAALLVSQSRGPWLAAAVILALAALGAGRAKAFVRMGVLLLPALALLIVPSLRMRAESIADRTQASNAERLHMWKAGWGFWKARPLLGIGPGNVKIASGAYQDAEEKAGGPWGHLHNTFVNFAAERGILGLGAFLNFIGVLIWELARGFRRLSAGAPARAFLWGGLLCIAGLLLSGLTETTYNASILMMAFYFIEGLCLWIARRAEHIP